MSRVVLSKTAFLSTANDRKREDVPMPEFGEGAVIPVWAMTARERTAFERGGGRFGIPAANLLAELVDAHDPGRDGGLHLPVPRRRHPAH